MKVSELIEKLLPKSADRVMIVDTDDPQDLESKQAPLGAIAQAAKSTGSININQGATQQTGITETPVKLTGFNSAQGFNGLAVNITPDKANNRLVATHDGAYVATVFVSAFGKANTKFTFEVYVNGAPTERTNARSTTSATDSMSASFGADMQLLVDDVVEIYVNSDDSQGANLTIEYAQFIISR